MWRELTKKREEKESEGVSGRVVDVLLAPAESELSLGEARCHCWTSHTHAGPACHTGQPCQRGMGSPRQRHRTCGRTWPSPRLGICHGRTSESGSRGMLGERSADRCQSLVRLVQPMMSQGQLGPSVWEQRSIGKKHTHFMTVILCT